MAKTFATSKQFSYNAISQGTLTTSLVSYFPMEGNSNDYFGTNNGADTNMTYNTTAGRVGQGAYGGTTGSTTFPLILTATSSWSVSFWTQTSSTAQNQLSMVSNGTSTNGWGVGQTNGAGSGTGTHLTVIISNVAFHDFGAAFTATGTWYFVVLSETAGTMTAYLNGAQLGTATTTSMITPTGNSFIFSCYKGCGLEYLGYIDEVGFWNKGLSVTEINELYNAGLGQTMCAIGGTPLCPISADSTFNGFSTFGNGVIFR